MEKKLRGIEGIEGLERCPSCYTLPEYSIDDAKPHTIILECKRHGHIAMGDDIEGVKKNWNKYVSFMTKVA